MAIATHSFTPDQFLHPLDVIRMEHDRQLQIADRLVELAKDQRLEPVMEEAEALITVLTEDLPLHHRDEEDDLFRMLKIRCRPEDRIDSILAELDKDHAAESFLRNSVVVDLKAILDGRALESPMGFFMDLGTFAEGQRRHLAWENSAVLPLAHQRLTSENLIEMGRNMATRRELAYPALGGNRGWR